MEFLLPPGGKLYPAVPEYDNNPPGSYSIFYHTGLRCFSHKVFFSFSLSEYMDL